MTFWCGLLSCLFVIPNPADRELKLKADANQMVAKAMLAEAAWQGFPGFVADIEVGFNGKVSRGRIILERDGRVFVEGVPDIHTPWVMQHLGCVVQQRFPKNYAEKKNWMFVNLKGERGSLGQAVCRADAPFGPYHWIQNQQFQALEVRSARSKERLTTLKTERNPDDKHLPVVQVSHRWNIRTLELEASEATVLSWRRVGAFDLPDTIQVLSAGTAAEATTPEMGRIVLTRHQLFSPPDTKIASRQDRRLP